MYTRINAHIYYVFSYLRESNGIMGIHFEEQKKQLRRWIQPKRINMKEIDLLANEPRDYLCTYNLTPISELLFIFFIIQNEIYKYR